MQTYRIFLVDEQNQYKGAEVLECLDDQAALEHAGLYVDGSDVEVWEHERLVAKLTANQPPEIKTDPLPRECSGSLRTSATMADVALSDPERFTDFDRDATKPRYGSHYP